MVCREVRGLADAFVSEQVLDETAEAIATHLEHCASCRADVDGLRRLRRVVRSAFLTARNLSPRPDFLATMSGRLRAEAVHSRAHRPWRRHWLAAAAALAFVVGSGFGLCGQGISGFTAMVHAAVGDHRFCVVAFRLARRPLALDEAARLYDDPVDRSLDTVEPQPTPLAGGTVHVLERHACVFDNRRFAHLVLGYRQGLISLVVTPDERLLRALPGASAPADGSVVTLGPVDGFHVAAFRGPRHVVFLISTLSDADLRDVAGSMKPSVSRALKGL